MKNSNAIKPFKTVTSIQQTQIFNTWILCLLYVLLQRHIKIVSKGCVRKDVYTNASNRCFIYVRCHHLKIANLWKSWIIFHFFSKYFVILASLSVNILQSQIWYNQTYKIRLKEYVLLRSLFKIFTIFWRYLAWNIYKSQLLKVQIPWLIKIFKI